MRSTIDKGGRVVIPKAIRDALHLAADSPVEIRERDGAVVIEPVSEPLELVEKNGVLVAQPSRPLPALTAAEVRETLESTRR